MRSVRSRRRVWLGRCKLGRMARVQRSLGMGGLLGCLLGSWAWSAEWPETTAPDGADQTGPTQPGDPAQPGQPTQPMQPTGDEPVPGEAIEGDGASEFVSSAPSGGGGGIEAAGTFSGGGRGQAPDT